MRSARSGVVDNVTIERGAQVRRAVLGDGVRFAPVSESRMPWSCGLNS